MPDLIGIMPVYNEANRYLEQVLKHLIKFVDKIVILDDGSTDHTSEICQSFTQIIYHSRETSMFDKDESVLRAQLWEYATLLQPEWVLAIDADEMFEQRAELEFPSLLKQRDFTAVDFRLFDFWNDFQYRIDSGWNPWVKAHRMLVKFDPSIPNNWPNKTIHCGRFPLGYYAMPYAFQSDFRVKHFGWMIPEERHRKYQFYIKRNPNDKHAQSIIDSDEVVMLEEWIPCKTIPFLG